MLRELGNDEQKDRFFDYIELNKALSFLAVSEPGKGSDAANMETQLIKQIDGNYLLNGEKWLVGHGADANIGVVIARTTKGPLGITAVLLTPELLEKYDNTNCLERYHLDVLGLHGARVSYLKFNNMPIPKENRLGQHLKPMQSGMMAVMKTFNQMRPSVGAFALGSAQAIIDYLLTHYNKATNHQQIVLAKLNAEIKSARNLLHGAAKSIDQDSTISSYASVAKAKATAVVEKAMATAIEFLGTSLWFDHPLLAKWQRDIYGYEYMEGTTNIQHKNIYQGFVNGRFIKGDTTNSELIA